MSISVSTHTQWFHQNEFRMLSDIFGVLVKMGRQRDNRDGGVNEMISAEGLALFLSSLPL